MLCSAHTVDQKRTKPELKNVNTVDGTLPSFSTFKPLNGKQTSKSSTERGKKKRAKRCGQVAVKGQHIKCVHRQPLVSADDVAMARKRVL